jgi:hypothetical protein
MGMIFSIHALMNVLKIYEPVLQLQIIFLQFSLNDDLNDQLSLNDDLNDQLSLNDDLNDQLSLNDDLNDDLIF